MTEIDNEIDLFFRDPAEKPSLPATLGLLYYLRRDIERCIAADDIILFPAAMTIMAGIDLLGKFYAGEDGAGVGDRFKDFVDEYFQPISPKDADVIYALRCALMHSFGLYSEDYVLGVIPWELEALINRDPSDSSHCLISVATLYEKFETSVERYRADLEENDALQARFQRMFPRYGTITIAMPTMDKSE
jgi:hypothetical protein